MFGPITLVQFILQYSFYFPYNKFGSAHRPEDGYTVTLINYAIINNVIIILSVTEISIDINTASLV